MPIHDSLTRTEEGAVSHILRQFDRQIEPVADVLEGLKRIAPPLAFGLDEEFVALVKLRDTLNQRWLHYMTYKEWKNGEETTNRLGTARASARAINDKESH